MFPFAIGAVVEGVPTTVHTPLSGHFSPVFAVVPMGALDMGSVSLLLQLRLTLNYFSLRTPLNGVPSDFTSIKRPVLVSLFT